MAIQVRTAVVGMRLRVISLRGFLMLKLLKTDICSAIKSEDSEALDSGTSQLGSQRGFGEIEMF